MLTSVPSVREVIKRLEFLYFCIGNAADKYFSLQAARKELFKDSTGKIVISWHDCYTHVYARIEHSCNI